MTAKSLKNLLALILIVVFLFQCRVVIVKYLSGKRTLSTEQNTVDDLKFPSVTICPKSTRESQTWPEQHIQLGATLEKWIEEYLQDSDKPMDEALTFQSMFEQIPPQDFIALVRDPFSDPGGIDMKDRQNFQPHEYDKIWTNYTTPNKELSWLTLTKCVTYNSPTFTTSGHKLHIFLQGNNKTWFQVFLHEKETFFPSNNKLYGSEAFPIKMDDRDSVEYELTVKRRIAMNADPVPCHQNEPYPLFHECLDDFMERAIGCRLPWRNGSNPGLPTCQSSIQFQEYWINVDNLIDEGESQLYFRTGCYTKCRRHYLKISKHPTKSNYDDRKGLMEIRFVYKEPEIIVETESLAYDIYDLIGDIGGFLGLLLGVSVLTIWDLCTDLWNTVFKK